MYSSSRRLVNGYTKIRQISNFLTDRTGIHAIQLSKDGTLLAIGNDSGELEIRACTKGGKAWPLTALFFTGAAIRSLLWHPVLPKTVIAGATNGLIYQITVREDEDHIVHHGEVDGYIYAMAMSPDGKDLVVAYGRRVAIIKAPFHDGSQLGNPLDVSIFDLMHQRAEGRNLELVQLRIPRSIHFFTNDLFAMTFFGNSPIGLFDRSGSFIALIKLRTNSHVGSSAVSLSGERLAVFNLVDGVDWYSLSHRKYLTTTRYALDDTRPPSNLLVDIAFIDEDTVAVGHMTGAIYLVSFGHPSVSSSMIVQLAKTPVRTLTIGNYGTQACILTVYQKRRSPGKSFVSLLVTEGQGVLKQESIAEPVVNQAKTFRLTCTQATFVILSLWFAIILKRLPVFSSDRFSTLEPSELNGRLQIPAQAIICQTETSTVHVFHTSVVKVTERPTTISACICTVTGWVTSPEHVPTSIPNGEVAVGRLFY